MRRAAGAFAEPYEEAMEDGYPIECGLTQEDADRINADIREGMKKEYAAMLVAAAKGER